MSTKVETLSQYALMASLWSIKIIDDINEYGFAIGYNNKTYKDLETVMEDTRKSISHMVEQKELTQDIDTDEAMDILFPNISKTKGYTNV
jgi:hypothetical protein